MAEYSYVLDDAELARYDAMAARAFEHEAELWDPAGIVTGAAVVYLGCGPGAFLAALAARTAPSGTVVGVDDADHAVSTAAFILDRAVHRVDSLAVQRSPAWTARQMMIAAGHRGRGPPGANLSPARSCLYRLLNGEVAGPERRSRTIGPASP